VSKPRVFALPVGVAVLALFVLLTNVAQAQEAPRITQAIDETNRVTLGGHVIPFATAANDQGVVVDSLPLEHLQLVLQRSPEREQALEQLMAEQNDSTSPNYHQWLTPEQFGEQFGVAQEDIDAVTGWLESHGFTVNKVYTNRMMIDFSGNAGQLRDTFRAEIHHMNVKGEPHMANFTNPQIPSALAPVIAGLGSLHDIMPKPMHEPVTNYNFAGCTARATEAGTSTCYAVTAQDNQAIYGLNPLYATGITGTGQTIYLVEDTDTYNTPGTSGNSNGKSDWQTYVSTFGLSGYGGTYTTYHPGSCSDPGTNGDDGEAAIDVEVAAAIAPGANIALISCSGSTFTFGGQVALQNLINAAPTKANPIGVVSVSYGLCEALTGQGGNTLFSNTYQQAAAEGYSIFVSSGDEGPSSCSNLFSTNGYDVASIGVTGWGDTAYNVAVGGTDFEDTYNSKKANVSEGGVTIPVSTYWNSTNTASYGSAKGYIPEMPWNDSCADALISEMVNGTFVPYGASPATCNNSSFDTTSTYMISGAGSGGASNCATGTNGTNQTSYLISGGDCQGWPKPSWQSAYGVPADGLRDIPDVSMFAANGIFGHYETVCWSDPTQSSSGSTTCSGAPSTWSGFGGTSVASPTMAAVQALVNQKTGEYWGNPNPTYYQIAQAEYGTQGGTFLGAKCNSSGAGGPAAGCAFNDVTQGDIDIACKDNGTTQEAACYKPAGTYGVDSTDYVTAATVINGGTGYTSAPTCTVAGPTNNQPYLAPDGTTLYAGGKQATCTAAVNSGTTTSVWTIAISSKTASGSTIVFTNNSGNVLATYTLSGTSTTIIATNLRTSINGGTFATASGSGTSVTVTAKVAGYAGNFNVAWGSFEAPDYVVITNTTIGQGPNYVSGITIGTAGVGYAPQTPITLTGTGSGAVAVANTSPGTAAQSYQPTYGAAPGYDLATGLGSPNAYYLVNASIWLKPQSITWTQTLGPYTYGQSPVTLTATASSGLAVAYTVYSGPGSISGNILTITGAGNIVINADQAGNGAYSAAATVQQTVEVNPAPVTATAGGYSGAYDGFTHALSACQVTGAYTGALACINNPTGPVGPGVGSGTVVPWVGGDILSNYNITLVNGAWSITKASQTITFGAIPTQAPGTPLNLSATASSGLPVSFTSNTTSVCTVSGGTATFLQAGNCSITAAQPGNTNYNAATSVTQTFAVVSAQSASPTATAVVTGSHASGYTLTITVKNTGTGTASNVVLTAATLGTTSGTPLPQTWGTIAAGGTGTFTVSFPGSVGLDGAGVAEKFSGTYTGGSFSASIRSITLP